MIPHVRVQHFSERRGKFSGNAEPSVEASQVSAMEMIPSPDVEGRIAGELTDKAFLAFAEQCRKVKNKAEAKLLYISYA